MPDQSAPQENIGMNMEKGWLEKYENKMYEGYINMDDIPALLQEHTERIIKEIEGIKVPNEKAWDHDDVIYNSGFRDALDAVINHLKK